MKKFLNKIVLWMLIIVLTFNTSLSYASNYTFSAGSNTVTKSQAEDGFTFSVDTTGIYSLTVLPIIEDSPWNYSLSYDDKNMPLAALQSDTLKDKDGNPLYQIYSKSVPYFVLKAGTEYKMQIVSNILSGSEQFVTIKLGTPIINDTYYEATSGNALGEIDGNNFQYLLYNRDPVSQAGVTEVDAASVLSGEAKANLVEQLLTSFFVDVVGDGIMFLIGVAAGEPVTIDKIIFNEYTRTRLGFFTNDIYNEDNTPKADKYNSFLSEGGLIGKDGILNKFFNRFTYIAIAAYLIILLYMGIRIVLSSTGKGMARYKKLFFDWVLGIIILFLFPYVIRYTIKINDAVVSYIGSLRTRANISIEEAEIIDYPGGLAFPFAYLGADAAASQDYMSQMRTKALETGRIMYAICWFVMIKELVAFLLIYIKRLLITLFLIVIFPLVTISYAVDKIGDGKSQAFNKWFSEYILNVFLQMFHAINYVVVMGIVFAVGKSNTDVNFILVIIGITYLAQGDKILRGIFSRMKGSGAGTVKDVAASMLATSGAMSVLKSSVSTIGGGFKKLSAVNNKRLQKNDDVSKLQEYKAKQKWDEWNLSSGNGMSLASQSTNGENNISEDAAKINIKIALSSSATTDQLRNALNGLRDYSNAGGNMANLYRSMNLTDKQQAQVKGLMEQNDAVDALQNVKILSEAEINAHLNVLIHNRKQKGNFAKLDRTLEDKGFTHELQDKLAETTRKRLIDSDDEEELARVRSSICTKADAERLRKIQPIDKEIATLEAKKQRASKLITTMENGIKNGEYGDKTEEYKERLKTAKSREFGYRQKLFELNEQKEKITAKMTNKNVKLSDGSYSKADRVNHYLEVAKLSNGLGEITEEQKEIAEAQAILDGSDTGEFTLSEIWEANKKITKARKASTDNAVISIIRNADSNPEAKKTSTFTAQLAATVINNEEALDGTSHDKKVTVSEAEKVIVEEVEDTPIYQHIINEAGFKIDKDDWGKKKLEKLKKADIVKEVVQDIVDAEETQLKEDIANDNKKITDNASYEKMKKKVFQERLDLTREAAKITAATVTTPAVALTSTAMYSGAASELKPSTLIGVAKLGTDVTSNVRDKAIDFAINRVSNVTNVASGVADSVKSTGPIITSDKKLDLKNVATIADKSISTIDDNEKGVKTRNITLTTETEPDKLTKEEEYRKKVLEERKAAIERMNKKIERFANGVETSTNTSSSSHNQRNNRRNNERPRNTTNERRPLTQADRNRQIFDRLNNPNSNNGKY